MPTPPPYEEVRDRIQITPEELLEALSQRHGVLVHGVAMELQNQKFRQIMGEIYADETTDEDEG